MSYWLCADNDVEDLKVNSWRWGTTMMLIQQSNLLEAGVEIFGDRIVISSAESCAKLADWFESHILPGMEQGSRVKLDGSITSEPDDGTIHHDDLAETYSVDHEWLLEFVPFLRGCGGFRTIG
jgi:hypothetical protein